MRRRKKLQSQVRKAASSSYLLRATLTRDAHGALPVSMTLPEFRRAVLANVEAAAVAKARALGRSES